MKKTLKRVGCCLLCIALLLTVIPVSVFEVRAAEEVNHDENVDVQGEENTMQEEDKPAVNEDPTEEEEPVVNEEPTEEEEPAVNEEPTEEEEPVVNEEPTEGEEPAGSEEPAEEEEPAEGDEPAEGEEPTEGEEFAEGEEPTEGEEPAEGEESAEGEEPTGVETTIPREEATTVELLTEGEENAESEEPTDEEEEADTYPEMIVSAKANGTDYYGDLTNKQITITLDVKSGSSKIKAVKSAFIADGDSNDENVKWSTVPVNAENGNYEIILGEVLNDKKIPNSNMEGKELPYGDVEEKVESSDTNTVKPFSQNGVYYFKIIAEDGTEYNSTNVFQKVNIRQQNIITGNAKADRAYDVTGWYNENTGSPVVLFDWPEQQENLQGEIITHFYMYKMDENGVEQETPITALDVKQQDLVTLNNYEINKDGRYSLYIWSSDDAGNCSEIEKYYANVDLTAPEELSLKIGETDITRESDNENNSGEIIYNSFFQDSVIVAFDGKDDVSGINWETKTFYVNDTKKDFTEVLTIDPSIRCYVGAEVYDYAGNKGKVFSNGFVVDNEAPAGDGTEELTIKPTGVNKNGFINKDFAVKIFVQDMPIGGNNAALKNVSYQISNESGKTLEGELFNFSNENVTDAVLSEAEKKEDKIQVKAAKMEGNDVVIKVTAEDNSGNSKSSEKAVKIDVTKPEITVEFDNNDAINGRYYKNSRVAHITIKEKNFNASGVEIAITKNGNAVENPSVGSWKSNGDTHTAELKFSEDGFYTFKINCTDLAGNEAKGIEVEPFAIDRTLPLVMISYDVTPYEQNYYNSAVTATITVVEQNFSEKGFVLQAESSASVGAWVHSGDTHKINIVFSKEGKHTWQMNYTDLAGNQMQPRQPEVFIIDTIQPQIVIEGVENNSANAGEIAPIVTILDENLNLDNIEIALTNGRGENISLEKNISEIAQGLKYRLVNVSGQKDSVYHLLVKGIDRAGNITELNYRFSLNRNGSTYDLSSAKDMVEKVYNQYEDITDIKILETNVDKIETFDIYINRNGKMIPGIRVSDMPLIYSNDAVYYSVNLWGDENNGYTYVYNIFRENFKEEGTYNITFSSVDRAGNRMNNAQAEEGMTIGFIVDDTPPMVFIDGVESNMVYTTENLDVNVYVTDNFCLKEAEFYLVNEAGEKVKTWNYMELAEGTGDNIMLTIPESNKKQSLLYSVIDEAGNEKIVLVGDEGVPSDFLITAETVSQIVDVDEEIEDTVIVMSGNIDSSVMSPVIRFALAGVAGVIIIGTAILIGRRKRLKELAENK